MDTQTAVAEIGADTQKAQAKLSRLLVFACWLVYMGSFLTKMLYSAELVEIIADLGITKAEGGLPLTCYYITYGIFQVVFAVFISRFNVRKVYTVCVGVSAVVFMLGTVLSSLPALMLMYAAIGILQCCSWGGLLHLITVYVHPDKQAFAVGFLCTGYSVSNLLAYLMAYVSLAMGSWKYAFLFGGVFLLLTLVFFFFVTGRVEKRMPKNARPVPPVSDAAEKKTRRFSWGCILFLSLSVIGCFMTSALYTAGANYLPMLLVDVHEMPSKYSVLISTLMPVFVTLGPFIITAVCSRKGTFILRTAWFLCLAAVLPLSLFFCYDSSILLTILCSALFSMLIRGVCTGYISIAPLHMNGEMPAGTFSSIANVGGTVAAAVTPVLFGYILDRFGWGMSYWMLLAATLFVALLHAVTAVLLAHPRHRQKERSTRRYAHRRSVR